MSTDDGQRGGPGKATDMERYKQAQVSRTNQQMLIYIVVAVVIASAWFLGTLGFSFIWIFLLIMVVFVLWWGKVVRLTEEHIKHAEIMVHRKRALRYSETSEWLNFIINRWWVFSSPSIADLIKKNLDPILNVVKPTFLENIEIGEFTLGDNTPFIKFVRVFENTNQAGRKSASWMNVVQPPPGLSQFAKYQVVMEVEMGLQCDDFRLVFQTRFGGKRMGMNLDVAVEKLNISGKLQMIFNMSMDSAFPHISTITISFVDKPEVWFSVNVLKAVQIMEIPILKSWIHSLVMDGMTHALVDPGKVDIKLESSGPSYAPARVPKKSKAAGVLTITLSGENPKSNMLIEEFRYCTLKVGDQKQHSQQTQGPVNWQDTCSFLIENLKKDKVIVKSKSKRFLSTYTLAQFELPLSNYPFEHKDRIETSIERKISKWDHGGVIKLDVVMEFTALPHINVDNLESQPIGAIDTVSGVLYVCVHGATNLMALDRTGTSDPYCIIFNNGKKVKTTHYVCRTRSPTWEVSSEFFVGDFTKTMLSFIVYDWDGYNATEDDFLGSTYLMLSKDEPQVCRRILTLGYNMANFGQVENSNMGNIIVSAIFRPVPSVAKSDKDSRTCSVSAQDYHNDKSNRNKNLLTSANVAADSGTKSKFSLRERRKSLDSMGVGDILSMGYGVLELNIIRAKDLVSMDSNGFSDPFCEVKIASERKFTTSVKKKTLNPVWDEWVTIQLPKPNETLEILCWDRDMFFRKDFLGSLTFSLEDLKKFNTENGPEWFQLKRITSGEILLQFKVISEEVALATLQNSDRVPLLSPTSVSEDSDSPFVSSTRQSLSTDHDQIDVEITPKTSSQLQNSRPEEKANTGPVSVTEPAPIIIPTKNKEEVTENAPIQSSPDYSSLRIPKKKKVPTATLR